MCSLSLLPIFRTWQENPGNSLSSLISSRYFCYLLSFFFCFCSLVDTHSFQSRNQREPIPVLFLFFWLPSFLISLVLIGYDPFHWQFCITVMGFYLFQFFNNFIEAAIIEITLNFRWTQKLALTRCLAYTIYSPFWWKFDHRCILKHLLLGWILPVLFPVLHQILSSQTLSLFQYFGKARPQSA